MNALKEARKYSLSSHKLWKPQRNALRQAQKCPLALNKMKAQTLTDSSFKTMFEKKTCVYKFQQQYIHLFRSAANVSQDGVEKTNAHERWLKMWTIQNYIIFTDSRKYWQENKLNEQNKSKMIKWTDSPASKGSSQLRGISASLNIHSAHTERILLTSWPAEHQDPPPTNLKVNIKFYKIIVLQKSIDTELTLKQWNRVSASLRLVSD